MANREESKLRKNGLADWRIWLAAGGLAVAATGAGWLGEVSRAQTPTAAEAAPHADQIGRYRLESVPLNSSVGGGMVVKIDTATGKTWYATVYGPDSIRGWRELNDFVSK